MIDKIDEFHFILLNLNNYNREEKGKNKETLAKINSLLRNTVNAISDETYEWQCYLLLMFREVIKELVKDNQSQISYNKFRLNVIASLKVIEKYTELNQSVLMLYPEMQVNHPEDSEKKVEEQNSSDTLNIYYKEELSVGNYSDSSFVFEDIGINEVKEVSERKEVPIPIELNQEESKQSEQGIEEYFNEKSQTCILKQHKEIQQKAQVKDPPTVNKPLQQSFASINKMRNNYIVDANSNDAIKRIDEIIEKINSFESIISFIKTNALSNETSLSSFLHGLLSLIPRKPYESLQINKIATLTLFFFPFLTENQKNSNVDWIKSMLPKQDLVNPLLTNVFFQTTEKENKQFATELLCNLIINKPISHEMINKRIHSIQTLDDIKELFMLQQLINVIIPQKESISLQLELSLANISFIILFIVKNEKHFPLLNINQFLLDCYTMKKLYDCYSMPLNALLSIDYEKTVSISFNNDKLNKAKEDMSIKEYRKCLFTEGSKRTYRDAMAFIKHFYVINDYSLPRMLSHTNLSFVLENNELQFIHSRLKYNNLAAFRRTLIKLEGNIYKITKTTFKHDSPILLIHEIPKTAQKIFNILQSDLKRQFNTWKFVLYPFGSITQFLSANDSDLDVFLDLSAVPVNYRVLFVRRLFNYIQDLDERAFNRNSFRICLISFTFRGLKIDLSCFALCPYLHSNLIRCYSLMDSRFSILVVALKKFLSVLHLKNDNEKNSTLNSFCWIMLLIVFLQDIISPPVLPKLLMNSPYVGKLIEIGGCKPKSAILQQKKKKYHYYNSHLNGKTIQQVFDHTAFNYIEVSPNAFDNYEEVYKANIREKNLLSLSELFLKFLEFVIFLFKYDTIFPSFTFFNEAFMNLSDIKLAIKDFGLRRFYFQRYLPKPKGEILFREPFDYNYNPGQSLNDAAKLFDKLKEAYYTLLEHGTFESLAKLNVKVAENRQFGDEEDYIEGFNSQ